MLLLSEGQNVSASQISSTYRNSSWIITTSGLGKQTSAILEFYFRFHFRSLYRNGRVILRQADEFRTNRTTQGGNMTSYRFCNMAAAAAQYYFQFRTYWCQCLQKVKQLGQSLSANQISSKYLHSRLRYYCFPFGKTRPPYWNSTSGFDLDHFRVICISFCIRLPNFIQIGAHTAEICHIHLSRWHPRPLNTTSSLVFVDVAAFRRSKSTSKPNFVHISQLTAEI